MAFNRPCGKIVNSEIRQNLCTRGTDLISKETQDYNIKNVTKSTENDTKSTNVTKSIEKVTKSTDVTKFNKTEENINVK